MALADTFKQTAQAETKMEQKSRRRGTLQNLHGTYWLCDQSGLKEDIWHKQQHTNICLPGDYSTGQEPVNKNSKNGSISMTS